MLHDFEDANVAHTTGPRFAGDAAVRVIAPADFDAAVQEITRWDGYEPTPLTGLAGLADALTVASVDYKHEGPRFGLGSFKALGGAYAALLVLQREITVRTGRRVALASVTDPEFATLVSGITLTTAIDGNHGRSVAWGARRLGANCRIYVHADVSEGRAEAIRDLGADVIRVAGDYDHSVAAAREESETNGWFVVSDTSWPGYAETPRDVMAGYGIMAREIVAALDCPPTHVFLQGGVGALAGSVVAAFRQSWGPESPRAIVVEPELARCLFASAQAGRATAVPVTEESLMAGLSCGEPSALAWEILSEEVSDFLTIPEGLVAPAMRLMAEPISGDPAVETGESGIAGLAGFIGAAVQDDLRRACGLDGDSRVLLIGSEGVTDRTVYERVLGEGG